MSYESFRPRPEYGTPSHADGGQKLPTDLDHRVCLRHPGYSDTFNILLVLPALDHPQGGLHHETARIACAILANNRWEGFLTETKRGQPIQVGPDGILQGKDYYFRVSQDDADEKYAVVPSFAHWRFPHNDLPQAWTSSQPPNLPLDRALPRQGTLTETTLVRDISCRITNHIEGTEHAHLVPRSEADWFRDNAMFQYRGQLGYEPVDDSRNAILFRSDVHTLFDQKRFAVVPKSSALVVHVTAPGYSFELSNLYHNVPLKPLAGVAVEYLLARFAWTIFGLSKDFIEQNIKRTLCIHVGGGQTSIEEFSGEQCRQQFSSGPKSRSMSPKKRSFYSSSQDSSFDEKLWTLDTDTEDGLDTENEWGERCIRVKGERQSKRQCLTGLG